MRKRMGGRSSAAAKFALGVMGGVLVASPAFAQGATDALSEEIVVTATKRGDVLAQDVPGALTAFGAEQLEALNFQTLQSLTYTMPNVQLEDIGTAPGVANFGIRGLGINSSIPSVDPTVGVFVDGMYYGINAGIVVDNFDLEAIEVLRGPQGTLYGRNVTGGAVLIRTSLPSDEFTMSGRVGVETGLEYTGDFVVSGPLVPGGVLSAKLAVYHNEDEGWFENDFDGSQFGASEMNIYRLALRGQVGHSTELILRLEQGFSESDGPAAQNHALHERGSFDFAINNRGFASGDWEQAILEANIDVPFGDGTVTNILGWRGYQGYSGGDIDATTFTAFHARAVNHQDQWSNELRYAGTFGPVDVTTGVYWFDQNLLYIEERFLFAGLLPTAASPGPPPLQYAAADPFWITRVGGGDGEFSTSAVFANADWHITDGLTFSLGVRYTEEEKQARISRIRRGVTPVTQPITVAPIPALVGLFILPADNLDGGATPPGDGVVGGSIDGEFLNFSDSPFDLSWNDTSPRVGIQWEPNPDTNIYAFAAKGFRSGGVNFRVTTLGTPPTAFDAEEQTSYEIGWKQDFMDGRGRVNFAVFHNTIEGMQRETNFPDPSSGVQQVIVNAGNAIIQGAELEARFNFTENFLVSAQVGYTDGEYDTITADLSGDGLVNDVDRNLEIPRLAPWTYGVNLIYDLPIMGGVLSSRVGYNHRDAAFYTDNNAGTLAEVDFFDANFTYTPDGGNWSLAIYGDNLTDEATWGGDTQLPDCANPPACTVSPPFGGDGVGPLPPPTFSPLNEGRVIGAELRLRY